MRSPFTLGLPFGPDQDEGGWGLGRCMPHADCPGPAQPAQPRLENSQWDVMLKSLRLSFEAICSDISRFLFSFLKIFSILCSIHVGLFQPSVNFHVASYNP